MYLLIMTLCVIEICREQAWWLSPGPSPVHYLNRFLLLMQETELYVLHHITAASWHQALYKLFLLGCVGHILIESRVTTTTGPPVNREESIYSVGRCDSTRSFIGQISITASTNIQSEQGTRASISTVHPVRA